MEARIICFLIISLIFCAIIIYILKRKNKRLRIKNKKLKNLIEYCYRTYGYFPSIKNISNNMKKFRELRKNLIRRELQEGEK